jgi:CBS domain-containing protein
MRAHQIMTRQVITVGPDTPLVEAAGTMLQNHVSGLPVVGGSGKLLGIVSEGDFIRRRNRHPAQTRPLAEISARPRFRGGRFRA